MKLDVEKFPSEWKSPIWFFVVLIVVTLANNRYLREELERIEDINSLFKNTNQENKFQLISEAKLEDLLLNLDTLDKPIQINNISHITIEEHYSMIFTQNEAQIYEVIEVRMPLKTIMEKLPQSLFLQIHYIRLALVQKNITSDN